MFNLACRYSTQYCRHTTKTRIEPTKQKPNIACETFSRCSVRSEWSNRMARACTHKLWSRWLASSEIFKQLFRSDSNRWATIRPINNFVRHREKRFAIRSVWRRDNHARTATHRSQWRWPVKTCPLFINSPWTSWVANIWRAVVFVPFAKIDFDKWKRFISVRVLAYVFSAPSTGWKYREKKTLANIARRLRMHSSQHPKWCDLLASIKVACATQNFQFYSKRNWEKIVATIAGIEIIYVWVVWRIDCRRLMTATTMIGNGASIKCQENPGGNGFRMRHI